MARCTGVSGSGSGPRSACSLPRARTRATTCTPACRSQSGKAPPVKPVTNRSLIGVVLYTAVAIAVVAAVGLGAWWFGSGMYGDIPEIVIPR